MTINKKLNIFIASIGVPPDTPTSSEMRFIGDSKLWGGAPYLTSD